MIYPAFPNYTKFCARIFKPGSDMDTSHGTMELLHAAVGISSEVSELMEPIVDFYTSEDEELDVPNILEEAGDIIFYSTMLMYKLRVSLDVPLNRKVDFVPIDTAQPLRLQLLDASHEMSIQAGLILDLVKKHWAYGKELPVGDVILHTAHLLQTLDAVLASLNYIIPEVIAHNTTKLKLRYPDNTYTDSHAQQRLDKESF